MRKNARFCSIMNIGRNIGTDGNLVITAKSGRFPKEVSVFFRGVVILPGKTCCLVINNCGNRAKFRHQYHGLFRTIFFRFNFLSI